MRPSDSRGISPPFADWKVRGEVAPTVAAGPPSVLFSALAYRANVNHRQYDVTPDGERFLMLGPVGDEGSDWILVLNFFEEIRASGASAP